MTAAAKLLTPFALALLVLPVAACQPTEVSLEHRVDSFRVVINEISPTPSKSGQDRDNAMPIPLGSVKFRVTVTAVDEKGEDMPEFDRRISFRSAPGNIVDVQAANGTTTGDRMMPFANGVATGWVVVDKLFGEVRLWAQDSPPSAVFTLADEDSGGGVDPKPDTGEEDGEDRKYARGSSGAVFFVQPTLADVQRIPVAAGKVDNRTSPFVGNFLTVDGTQSGADMIVSAITAEGFYMTDLNAKRLDTTDYKNTIGTFGHMYIYNYSYPDNLTVGDRVLSVTGTVQEFSGDTQMTFPSWVKREDPARPQDLPAPLLFDFSNPDKTNPSAGFKLCNINPGFPAVVPSINQLCSQHQNNINMESVESGLVKIVNAVPPAVFPNCDLNGNSQIPNFSAGPTGWSCFPAPPASELPDCQCNMNCVTSQGEFEGKPCSEYNAYNTYGQWTVRLEDTWQTRIAVTTRDALPEFNVRDFAKPEYAGCTVDITGILRQVVAARPRWLIMARTEADVCCRAPENGKCPPGIPECPKGP